MEKDVSHIGGMESLILNYRLKIGMKTKTKSKNQSLKISAKPPLIQQMPFKERPRRIQKNKKIDDTFA